MRALAKASSSLRGGATAQARAWPAPWHARIPRPLPAAARLRSASALGGGSDGDTCSSSSAGWLLDSNGSNGSPGWQASGPSSSAATSSSGATSSSSTSSGGGGSFDAIMMLGGGLLPTGGLPEWCVRRLEGCRHLYLGEQQRLRHEAEAAEDSLMEAQEAAAWSRQQGRAQAPQPQAWAPPPHRSCPVVLLGAGTPHKRPVVDDAGFVLHESTAYAAYLLRRGLPAADLLKEAQSYDTIGNAYFSLLTHALPAGWRRIAVVTSEFHMPRTRATFDFVYNLAGSQLYGDAAWFHLDYRPVSDEGIFDADVLAARAEKEAAAVAAWQRNTAGARAAWLAASVGILADLHAWLYATHLCYSVSRQHEFGRERDLDPRLAATY